MKKAAKGIETSAGESTLVDKAIQSIAEKLETKEVKATVGDLLRLLEFKKQLEENAERDITVKWIDDTSQE
jgi:hypothetical protein